MGGGGGGALVLESMSARGVRRGGKQLWRLRKRQALCFFSEFLHRRDELLLFTAEAAPCDRVSHLVIAAPSIYQRGRGVRL